MKQVFAIVLAGFAVACGTSALSPSGPVDQQARDAIPTTDTLAMTLPGPASNGDTSDRGGSAVGESSSFLLDTIELGTSVNGGVAFSLGLIKSITDLPASSCTSRTCTWGPGALALDPVSWTLVVTYNPGTGAYDFTLSGEAKQGGDKQLHPVVTGSASPSATANRGSGKLTIDFDALKSLNPAKDAAGKLDVIYSNANAGQATISAAFLGVKDAQQDGHTDNAQYAYAEDGLGGGSLQAAAQDNTSGALLSIDSRWNASGAGRSDVTVSSTDGQGGSYAATESECWASATSLSPPPFHIVYFTNTDPLNLGATSGNPNACAFSDMQPTSLRAP